MDIQQPQYESFLIHTEHIYNTERSLLACIVISLIIKCIILDGKKKMNECDRSMSEIWTSHIPFLFYIYIYIYIYIFKADLFNKNKVGWNFFGKSKKWNKCKQYHPFPPKSITTTLDSWEESTKLPTVSLL